MTGVQTCALPISSDYEVIIVDNNSIDNTQEIALSFVERYPNFRYIKEPKQGLSHSRNRGYKEAYGEYVAYIDDDARAEKKWVENIIGFALRRPDIVAFGGPYKRFVFEEIPKWYKDSYGSCNLGEEERPIAHNEWISGTNMIYKSSLLMELGGFDTRVGMSGDTVSYGEETNLLIKIKQKSLPIFYVPNIVVEHLIPDYKLSLKWMLKSHYMNGFSGFETFGMRRERVKWVLKTLYVGLKGLIKFILSKERYFKARILESFSGFIWNLGLTIRMFRG